MNFHRVIDDVPPMLNSALARFERQFFYPLGEDGVFRISHGENYPLFFRAIGESACFVAESQGVVSAVLTTAIRRLRMPDGTECSTAYLGDLKIAPDSRNGMLLSRLAKVAENWIRPKVAAAYGIVMGGTQRNPDAYTGRCGIPQFSKVGSVVIFRISAHRSVSCPANINETTESNGQHLCQKLTRGSFSCQTGNSFLRSQIPTTWFTSSGSDACGMLEDTRKAKTLINQDGQEIISAHLSSFAYQSIAAGVTLIRTALAKTALHGLPAMFVAIDATDAAAFHEALHPLSFTTAPASIYGAGLSYGRWHINTAEI